MVLVWSAYFVPVVFSSCNPNIMNMFGENKYLLRFIRYSQALFPDRWAAFTEEMARVWLRVCWDCTQVGKYGMI